VTALTNEDLTRLLTSAGGPDVDPTILRKFLTAVEDAQNPLLPVQKPAPVTRANGSVVFPSDDRFSIRIRTIYGEYIEQVIPAASIDDLLDKAKTLPLNAWIDWPDDIEDESEATAQYAAGIIDVVGGAVIEFVTASTVEAANGETEHLHHYRDLDQYPHLTTAVLVRDSDTEPWRIANTDGNHHS
jgi:hypothetical protein